MRTEQQMYDIILKTAESDPRILAVYMNGSRVNPNVPKDIFQDYDIVYVVADTKPFYEDETWIDHFGERLYMQMPEKMDALRGREFHFDEIYGWLMQFADGNRIDLHVVSPEYAQKDILSDKLCRILLDKEGILPAIPDATDEDYHVKKPSHEDFWCDCNNFWWCMNNVAKGLWRREIPYVMDMLNMIIRPHLVNLLSWEIGIRTNFACSVGKSGKYMYRYLERCDWEAFLKTYPDSDTEHIWQSVFVMCDLFEKTALQVADQLGYIYQREEAAASRYFLEHVKKLPEDAEEIFVSE
ncbi:MAG: aminoglycoside 6-adenylyltransferase [Lachnospiraceae bacterium]|nr:aminoglycoside 6-adenylyltransferase [Lachnospiraceae bacterium]